MTLVLLGKSDYLMKGEFVWTPMDKKKPSQVGLEMMRQGGKGQP